MRLAFILFIVFATTSSFAQKTGDTKIIITANDSTSIREKIKHALVDLDFLVKDDGKKDTLTTYSKEYDGIYCIVRAKIEGYVVTLTGAYGLKKLDDWGYTQSPKSYHPIIYFKGSKGWKLLIQAAYAISGNITYDK
jgi:hypothetical protein